MGENWDQVQKEIARVPYKVVKGDNNTPRVDIDGRLYTPQEISAMILQKMKKTAEDYLGSVPGVAHYQDEHVQFGGAGITVVDLK
jgi:molecular chaperone DnaK (HSP70)